jgi:hypothetical protein
MFCKAVSLIRAFVIHKRYTACEVAVILNMSPKTALRRMAKMDCRDLGTKPDVRARKSGRRMLEGHGQGAAPSDHGDFDLAVASEAASESFT